MEAFSNAWWEVSRVSSGPNGGAKVAIVRRGVDTIAGGLNTSRLDDSTNRAGENSVMVKGRKQRNKFVLSSDASRKQQNNPQKQ